VDRGEPFAFAVHSPFPKPPGSTRSYWKSRRSIPGTNWADHGGRWEQGAAEPAGRGSSRSFGPYGHPRLRVPFTHLIFKLENAGRTAASRPPDAVEEEYVGAGRGNRRRTSRAIPLAGGNRLPTGLPVAQAREVQEERKRKRPREDDDAGLSSTGARAPGCLGGLHDGVRSWRGRAGTAVPRKHRRQAAAPPLVRRPPILWISSYRGGK